MRIGQTSLVHLGARLLMTVAGFAGNIYFANVLGPGKFGRYVLIIATLMWISIAMKVGVPVAITKRVSERGESSGLISAGMLLIGVLFAIVATVMILLRGSFTSYLGVDHVVPLLVILAVRILLEYVQAVLNGQHKVHISASLNSIDWISRVGIQSVLVYLGYEVVGLLIGYTVSAILAIGVGALYVTYTAARPTRDDVRSLTDYAKYSWLAQVKARSFHALDTIVLGIFVSPALIGIYEIAWNVSSVFAIFGDSISQSMFPELSEAASKGDHGRAERYTADALAFAGILAIPGFVGAALVGDLVLSIYGSEFQAGQHILLILIVANILNVYESQVTAVIGAIDRPDIIFRIQSIYIGANVVLNLGLVYLFGWTGAAVATAISAGFGLSLGYYYLNQQLNVVFPVREIGRFSVAALVMGALVAGLRTILPHTILALLAMVIIGGIVYFTILVTISVRFQNAVQENVVKPLTGKSRMFASGNK